MEQELYVVFLFRRTHETVYEKVLRDYDWNPMCFESRFQAIAWLETDKAHSWGAIERLWPDRETRLYGLNDDGQWQEVAELPFDRPSYRSYKDRKGLGNSLDISIEEVRYAHATG